MEMKGKKEEMRRGENEERRMKREAVTL